MADLSKNSLWRAGVSADFFRKLACGTPRPAIARLGHLAVAIGTDEMLRFYETDGVFYLAQFGIDEHGRICWRRNDYMLDVRGLAMQIDRLFELLFALRRAYGSSAFGHWCSLRCYKDHGQLPGFRRTNA